MSESIWKFSLDIAQRPQILMCPDGAIVRHIGEQEGKICLWMEVVQSAEKQMRTFMIIGTGWELPPYRNYLGTVQIGSFVWHVFEYSKNRAQGPADGEGKT